MSSDDFIMFMDWLAMDARGVPFKALGVGSGMESKQDLSGLLNGDVPIFEQSLV